MPNADAAQETQLTGLSNALLLSGRALFSLAIVSIGIETMLCARVVAYPLSPRYAGLPVLPWLPAIPFVAYLFGVIWVLCGVGLLTKRGLRASALVLGSLLALCTLILILPKYVFHLGDIGLRTVVFEPLALACIAFLLPGQTTIPGWLARTCRSLIALAMIVFGWDHFVVLSFIASLLPGWIPWHIFWSAFFGVVFIAGGLSIGLGLLQRWGAAGLGLMFGIWVVTLHLPRVLGLYGIPGAPNNPNEWSSLFIAVGLWGGSWALTRRSPPKMKAPA